MKIKLALLEKDNNYLNRITAVFGVRFADKVEVLAYTDEESAVVALKAAKVNVFLASEDFDIEPTSLPDKCCFAYFVEDSAVKEIRGQRAICKFQQIDNIYKQILDVYAEKFQGVIGFNGDVKTTIWWFCSPGGGSGASSVAAATAIHFAKKQKKVLFVELDEFGNAEQYFQGGGQATFNELLMAIKGKKKNLSMKLESNVRTDIMTGVDFFSAPSLSLDINEFTADDVEVLIQEIIKLGLYDIVVFISLMLWDIFRFRN